MPAATTRTETNSSGREVIVSIGAGSPTWIQELVDDTRRWFESMNIQYQPLNGAENNDV